MEPSIRATDRMIILRARRKHHLPAPIRPAGDYVLYKDRVTGCGLFRRRRYKEKFLKFGIFTACITI